jgi:hypothetical protein
MRLEARLKRLEREHARIADAPAEVDKSALFDWDAFNALLLQYAEEWTDWDEAQIGPLFDGRYRPCGGDA